MPFTAVSAANAASAPASGEGGSDGGPATPPSSLARVAQAWRRRAVRRIEKQTFADDAFFHRYAVRRDAADLLNSHENDTRCDYLFATPEDARDPSDVFEHLRWGGQLIFMATQQWQVVEAAQLYHSRGGFVIDQGPSTARGRILGIPLPFSRPVYYFVARKIHLVPPGQYTDRFTFNVKLVRQRQLSDDYVVCKQMPTYGSVVARLRRKFPDTPLTVLESRARKLVDRVFPVFLTREAAFLQLLQRDLPEEHRARFPRVLAADKTENGLVKRIYMNWMRIGGEPLTQFEFAMQSAELLRVLHETANIIHLDLRLDNFVITPAGVGFVDFGSAVRMDENLAESPMLRSLFDEMMSTSQIQRTLGKMRDSGKLTSSLFINAYQRVDKAVDLFYLALQMNRPHLNPDFKQLVLHDPESEEAKRIRLLTDSVLRPKDPQRPAYISAADLVRGLKRIANRKNIDPEML